MRITDDKNSHSLLPAPDPQPLTPIFRATFPSHAVPVWWAAPAQGNEAAAAQRRGVPLAAAGVASDLHTRVALRVQAHAGPRGPALLTLSDRWGGSKIASHSPGPFCEVWPRDRSLPPCHHRTPRLRAPGFYRNVPPTASGRDGRQVRVSMVPAYLHCGLLSGRPACAHRKVITAGCSAFSVDHPPNASSTALTPLS